MAGPPIEIAAAESFEGPGFVAASLLPDRGMMLLQARLRLPSGAVVDALATPADALDQLDGGADDFAGNKSFAFGGAILAPYANRIRGRPLPDSREIETVVAGQRVRLPRNWGGKRPGAAQYAMHGLILDADVTVTAQTPARVAGRLDAGDFGGRWPSRAVLTFDWRLQAGALALAVGVENTGDADLPVGLGWHPYFALPSGDRRQARLRLPARLRVEVDDYDQVLPTGRLLEVAGTAYDFGGPDGAALGEAYLDDCFTDLTREAGEAVVEVRDPAAGLGLRIASATSAVKAVQVYAPPDRAIIVVEPQFNLADPYGSAWDPQVDNGMAVLKPGAAVEYDVRISAFAVGTS
jgi:aldose 1-epimerase